MNNDINKMKVFKEENHKHNKDAEKKIISLLDEDDEVNSDGNNNALTSMGCTAAC